MSPAPAPLFDRFTSPDNFASAFERIFRKGKKGGIDHVSIEAFAQRYYYSFLQPVAQFADLDQHIQKTFLRLVQKKVAARAWPPAPPADLQLPLLNASPAGAGRKRIRLIS